MRYYLNLDTELLKHDYFLLMYQQHPSYLCLFDNEHCSGTVTTGLFQHWKCFRSVHIAFFFYCSQWRMFSFRSFIFCSFPYEFYGKNFKKKDEHKGHMTEFGYSFWGYRFVNANTNVGTWAGKRSRYLKWLARCTTQVSSWFFCSIRRSSFSLSTVSFAT